MKRILALVLVLLFVSVVSVKASVFPSLKVFMGPSSKCTVMVLSPQDAGPSIDVTATSHLCDESRNSVTYQISVTCDKVGKKGGLFVYRGSFWLVEGPNDDSQDKLRVFSTPFVESPVLMSTNAADPLYCKVEVSWGGRTSTVWWWPNSFNIYYDDPSSGDKPYQHIIYDAGGGNTNGGIYLWSGETGATEKVDGAGNPGQAWRIYVADQNDYAGFGCFFDKDDDDANDAMADSNDLSVYYKGGYLQFDARVCSGSAPVYVKVELEKAVDNNYQNDVKFTKYVEISDTSWKTYKIYFEPGVDDPAGRVYHFSGLDESDFESVVGMALFTLEYNYTLNQKSCGVFIDNVKWCRGEAAGVNTGGSVATIDFDKSYYIGDDDTAHITVTTTEDEGSAIYVNVKSEMDSNGIVIQCNKTGANTYEGDFGFIQDGSFSDRIQVYVSSNACGVDSPPFTDVTVSYGASSNTTRWWPNPFRLYFDKPGGIIQHHMAYDWGEPAWNAAHWWTWGESPPAELASGGNPERCLKFSGTGGFGAFFDTNWDNTADPVDMSVYQNGYLEFDIKGDSEGKLKVEIQTQSGSKTLYVGCENTSWERRRIPLSLESGFGLSLTELQNVKAPVMMTLTDDGGGPLYVDNIMWKTGVSPGTVTISVDKSYYLGESDQATVTVQTTNDVGDTIDVKVESELNSDGDGVLTVKCDKVADNTYQGTLKFVQGTSIGRKIKTYPSTGSAGVDTTSPFTTLTVSFSSTSEEVKWWPNPFWIYHEKFDGVSWVAFQHMHYNVSGYWNSAKILSDGSSYSFSSDSDTPDGSSESLKVTVNAGGWGGWYHRFGVAAPVARDMSAYSDGYIKFDYKIDSGHDVKVKIEWSGGSDEKRIVADMGGTADGKWHTMSYSLSNFSGIDYCNITVPAGFWSVGDSYSFWIDNIRWEK